MQLLALLLPLLLLAACASAPRGTHAPVPVSIAPPVPAPPPRVAPMETVNPGAVPEAVVSPVLPRPARAEAQQGADEKQSATSPAAGVPGISDARPVDAAAAPEGLQGIASYYAKRFSGRRTTSGAVYDPEKLTAAHQDLPFGTRVKVVNLANSREVVVTVNDRCRKRKKPFIDLSRAAARELGFLGKGITKVRIIPLTGDGQSGRVRIAESER